MIFRLRDGLCVFFSDEFARYLPIGRQPLFKICSNETLIKKSVHNTPRRFLKSDKRQAALDSSQGLGVEKLPIGQLECAEEMHKATADADLPHSECVRYELLRP
eukprot:gnl/TRDRNA2_/TRDRNA2_120794_c0_seq1.p1 gnl/TRDRNA2_/TRDRNA2_120794_c0~~gnl/TRDRNA2_/TRDRNA2_120794_c0_seq1.p1  ORF type:complete len:104 (-),score=4.70 gnl/TRDRNA2_/TRDRNA2_120794_c0_seq1:486-797(-)